METRKKDRVTKSKKTNTAKKQQKQVSIFTLLFVTIVIGVVIGIYFGARALVITLKYKAYTDKMYTYGYNELYENDKATSVQNVTNADMLSVVIGTVTNTKDIEQGYYLADPNSKESLNWYNYAKYLGVSEIENEQELNKKATKIDAVILLTRMVEGYLGIDIEPAELKMSSKLLKKYNEEEQQTIAKAVSLGLVKNKNSAVKQKNIVKGELNKLMVQTVEKYGSIHHDSNANIVTKKSQMPDNYKDYPYIVDSIEKEIYELEFKITTEPDFMTPKATYEHLGDLYGQTDDRMTEHFEGLLNIDYETITVSGFLEKINRYSSYLLEEDDVKEYVEYVKKNKIKIEGKAEPLLPIMYNDGELYQTRTKITFKVINSDTEYNLLFGDSSVDNKKVKYTGKDITMYVDVPMGMTLNSRSLLVNTSRFAEHLAKPTTQVTVIEE